MHQISTFKLVSLITALGTSILLFPSLGELSVTGNGKFVGLNSEDVKEFRKGSVSQFLFTIIEIFFMLYIILKLLSMFWRLGVRAGKSAGTFTVERQPA
jgi:hypothetical protein